MNASQLPKDLAETVQTALQEDVGSGDITAGLIDSDLQASATVKVRETAILCGLPWFDEVFHQVDREVNIDWLAEEGDLIVDNQDVCKIQGAARSLLTAERTALNFLQTLSGTATITRQFVEAVAPYGVRILDTRKTIPGLRNAQKYAVAIGGGTNHRMGLYDGVLVKENHQYISLSPKSIIENLSADSTKLPLIEVEIESLDELEDAILSGANRIMLDNFSVADIATAVRLNRQRVELEASGSVDLNAIEAVAKTGVDFISVGALTKHVRAVDFSMTFTRPTR